MNIPTLRRKKSVRKRGKPSQTENRIKETSILRKCCIQTLQSLLLRSTLCPLWVLSHPLIVFHTQGISEPELKEWKNWSNSSNWYVISKVLIIVAIIGTFPLTITGTWAVAFKKKRKKSDKGSSTRLVQNSPLQELPKNELENTFHGTKESNVKFSSAFPRFPQVQENLPPSSVREVKTLCQTLVTWVQTHRQKNNVDRKVKEHFGKKLTRRKTASNSADFT